MTSRVSMGDPVKVLPLRQRIAWVLRYPSLAAGAPAPAYDVGRDVVMLTPAHRLHADLFEAGTDQVLESPGREAPGPGEDITTCRHLQPGQVALLPDGHVVGLEPEWVLCAGCARGVLGEWTGERRRCSSCDVDDAGDRLRLVRVPSARGGGATLVLVDVWCLLCPRCLGPVAAQRSW